MRDYTRALTAFDAALEAERVVRARLWSGAGRRCWRPTGRRRRWRRSRRRWRIDPSLDRLEPAGRGAALSKRAGRDRRGPDRRETRGALDDARRAYERALAISPDSAFLHRELGQLERRAGNTDRALEHLRRAVELDPTDATALVETGELLEARGDASRRRGCLPESDRHRSEPRTFLVASRPAARASARIASARRISRCADGAADHTRRSGGADRRAARGTGSSGAGAPGGRDRYAETLGRRPGSRRRPVPASSSRSRTTPSNRARSVRRGDLATVVSRLVALIAAANPSVRERLSPAAHDRRRAAPPSAVRRGASQPWRSV